MKPTLAALFAALFLATSCSTACAPQKATLPALKITKVAAAEAPAKAAEAEIPKNTIPHVVIGGSIDDAAAQQAVALFQAFEAAKIPIVLVEINSPGGSVDAGFVISKALEDSSAEVVCVVDGEAASMAYYILQSCDVRIMTDRSLLMIHEPSIAMRFRGNSADWAKVGKDLSGYLAKLSSAMNHHLARRLNISYDAFCKKIQEAGEWWLTDAEALKIGAVDRVVPSVDLVKKDLVKKLTK